MREARLILTTSLWRRCFPVAHSNALRVVRRRITSSGAGRKSTTPTDWTRVESCWQWKAVHVSRQEQREILQCYDHHPITLPASGTSPSTCCTIITRSEST